MSTQETSSGLTKWQIALLIGAPVAAACVIGAVWYMRSSSKKDLEAGENAEQDKITPASEEKSSGGEDLTPLQQAQAAKLKGNKYFKGAKYEQAINCYTDAIQLCPPDSKQDLSTFYQNRAAAHEQLKNFDAVISDCSKAVQLNNKYTKAYLRRARGYEQVNLMQECLQDLTAVCMLEGFSNPSWMEQADRVLKDVGKEKAKEYYKNRIPVIPSKTYVTAYLDSFSQDVTLDVSEFEDREDIPKDTPFLQAVKQIRQKSYDNVVDLCTQEIEKGEGPCYAKALALRGTMYTLMSQIKQAIDDLSIVIDMEESDENRKLQVNCLIKRGSLRVQEGNDDGAEADFASAIIRDPDNSDIYHHRGQLNFLSEKMTEAKRDFETCIELNDQFIPAKTQLAYCIYKSAAMQQAPILMRGAVQMLEKLVEKFPESPDAIGLYAQVLQDSQQFEKANEGFDIAIKLQPSNPVHFVYKGLLMVQWNQDLDKAIELVEQAIEVDDKCDFAYETLATLEVQRGNTDKAIKLFDKCIELVRTESEMAQSFSLRQAALAQAHVGTNMGLPMQTFM